MSCLALQCRLYFSFLANFKLLSSSYINYNSYRALSSNKTSMSLHTKCRNVPYPRQNIMRLPVPDDKVPWDVVWPDYQPPSFSMEGLATKPWADPDLGTPNFNPQWNNLDGNGTIDRCSHEGPYDLGPDGAPLNPRGRTGLAGRGYLGRWGPNHAADPIVTRWKPGAGIKMLHPDTQKPVLQFVAIQRHDTGEWAIPGGMVDPGEVVTKTLRREFCEEALNSLELSESRREQLDLRLQEFFAGGEEVYRGYVDDPRNTDQAWMETVAVNFHDEEGATAGLLPLEAGDDAAAVRWADVGSQLRLYASHSQLVHAVAIMLGAHW